jgi:hypothetical protein
MLTSAGLLALAVKRETPTSKDQRDFRTDACGGGGSMSQASCEQLAWQAEAQMEGVGTQSSLTGGTSDGGLPTPGIPKVHSNIS